MDTTEVRPAGYFYFDMLKDHLETLDKVFCGQPVYPRQLEIHLPGNGKEFCNFNCFYCQGRLLERPCGSWEETGLRLLDNLEGAVPYHIYGGAYSEPLMNEYLLKYLGMTKFFNNMFGIHTNGSYLLRLHNECDFIKRLVNLGCDDDDYLSVSLDAGTPESHMKIKGVDTDFFTDTIEGIRLAVKERDKQEWKYPAIRVCYLVNKFNCSKKELEGIVQICKDIGVDSLRFSIPYDVYGKDFDVVKKYRNSIEKEWAREIEKVILPLCSPKKGEGTYVFYFPPENQDVCRMRYKQCIYGYYQITLAADGKMYRCSSTSSPTFPFNCFGEITDDLEVFKKQVLMGQDPKWNPGTCFAAGARCNRMALECNSMWEER